MAPQPPGKSKSIRIAKLAMIAGIIIFASFPYHVSISISISNSNIKDDDDDGGILNNYYWTPPMPIQKQLGRMRQQQPPKQQGMPEPCHNNTELVCGQQGGYCDSDDDCGENGHCDLNYNKCGWYCSEHFGCSLALTYDDNMGRTMPYRLFLPLQLFQQQQQHQANNNLGRQRQEGAYSKANSNNNNKKLYPLILFMHGGAKKGLDNLRHVPAHNYLGGLIDSTQTEEYPSILLAPQLPSGKWNPIKNPKDYTPELLEYVIANYPVDINRIYITGICLGAFGVTRYVVDNPNLFAAAIPMSGGIGVVEPNSAIARSIRHVPFWLFHGDKDPAIHVDMSRNFVAALRSVRATNVRYDEIAGGGHSVWSPVYEDWRNGTRGVYDWLFAQSRSSNSNRSTAYSKLPKIHHAYPDETNVMIGARRTKPKRKRRKKKRKMLQ